jgi:hypothetical protein
MKEFPLGCVNAQSDFDGSANCAPPLVPGEYRVRENYTKMGAGCWVLVQKKRRQMKHVTIAALIIEQCNIPGGAKR